jgi:hypothetical protein
VLTVNGNVNLNDTSADTIAIGQNGGTPDVVTIAGNVSLADTQWSVAADGTIRAGTGSVTTPSISFTGDTQSGFFDQTSSGEFSLVVGGVEGLRFNSSGVNHGVGQYLHTNGTATAPSFAFSNATGTGMFRPAADSLGLATAGSERLRIDASGNVGIGTATPGTKLEVNGGIKGTSLDLAGGAISNLGVSGASLTRAGAHALTLTTTGTTNITLPTSGTLLTTGGDIALTSAAARTVSIADEATANSTAAPDLTLMGSNKTAGTGNGGSIFIKAGTSAGGTAGTISLGATNTSAINVGGNSGGSISIVSGPSLTLDLKSAPVTGAASGAITLMSGATTTSGNSGSIFIDAGAAAGTGGTITLAASNASALQLGRSGLQVSTPGGITNAGSISSSGSITLSSSAGLTVSGTGVMQNSNGNNTAPSYTFNGDPDTGMYHPNANEVGIAAGGQIKLAANLSAIQLFNNLLVSPNNQLTISTGADKIMP